MLSISGRQLMTLARAIATRAADASLNCAATTLSALIIHQSAREIFAELVCTPGRQ